MKKTKIFAAIGGIGLAVLSVFLVAADHADAPAVVGTTTDIADLYAFEGDNPNNTVLIATVQGPLMPGAQTENATFDEDVMLEFNIDNTGDFIEDLVVQVMKRGDSMYFFGPYEPAVKGLSSSVDASAPTNVVKISTSTDLEVTTNGNMSFYAGPRRDGFFFDSERFNEVANGTVAPEGFLPPGQASDFFDNLNVLAVAIEIPNGMLGTAPTHVAVDAGLFPPGALPNSYNVWVSAKRKQ